MLFSSALAALLPAIVTAINITVTVGVDASGAPANLILPNVITAQPGDFVNLQFMAGNHTVTQSPFDAPCTQLKNTVTGDLGIDTGFQPVVDGKSPVVVVFIADTKPIWSLFCNRKPHCNAGMVAVINPPPNKKFEDFKAAAATAPHPGSGVTAPFTPQADSGTIPQSGAPPAGTPQAGAPRSIGLTSLWAGFGLFSVVIGLL